ncbi:hypothetical protein EV368DRAFT_77021 [Lentinula lateritia]|uniref:Uncharacterized protein n=1 Tax=Lentinula aff. lateritia TaxID=2804960 RepID=A0ACC1TIK8_9AGAR|nr:hypothetical protein F5876DRAFT_91816 [Lentinula aff. lateritia]KAJ3846611.1 hypothetical protein EV368DRAFT_77021 [Lentinula lateritia]
MFRAEVRAWLRQMLMARIQTMTRKLCIHWFKTHYIGNDFPLKMPLPKFQEVQMAYYESVHYAFNGTQPQDIAEWDTVVNLPEGFGRVRLGPEWRTFVLTYYHQLHCLQSIHEAFTAPSSFDSSGHDHEHLEHCFNYLRQTFMCEAADSLERGNFHEQNFTADRIGETVVCRDWSSIFGAASENYRSWKHRHRFHSSI